jgi:hypothetical protein
VNRPTAPVLAEIKDVVAGFDRGETNARDAQ